MCVGEGAGAAAAAAGLNHEMLCAVKPHLKEFRIQPDSNPQPMDQQSIAYTYDNYQKVLKVKPRMCTMQ